MDYDVAFWLEDKLKEVSDSTIKLRSFCFFSITFKEVPQKLFQICSTP